MKLDSAGNAHSATTSATLFSEQVSKVCDLFQDWNDCERSVSLFAVLKRIPFSCTKFLQSVIDTNLNQAYCLEQTKLLEQNANSAAFIHSLHEAYASLSPRGESAASRAASSQSLSSATKRDSLIFGDVAAHNARRASLQPPPTHRQQRGGNKAETTLGSGAPKCYERKEDILGEVLTLMPILTPGNDEAKCAYLEFIPMTVEDAIRGAVNTSLVQQIFSYLLIHPAFSTDDRRSLSKFLRHLEEHIVSTDPNFVLYPNGPSPTADAANFPPTSSSTTNSGSMHPPHNSWQAIAPPTSKSTDTITSPWDSQHHLAPNNGPKSSSNPSINGTSANGAQMVANPYADDVPDFRCTNAMLDLRQPSVGGISPKLGHLYESGPEDQHISFSKNGTEILDFDCDDTDKSNTQIGFDTLANLNEFLTVPGVIDNITQLKTRRSNSLTTTGSVAAAGTASAQNLSHLMQKPRSFSLSMVSPRSSLTSSGSDTRLDDFKPNNYAKQQQQQLQHNVGMSNIGQWLKSLRLHKYVWLFSNITYEQMLGISEEYLQNLNVTKGARHKLVVCIQRLKDRHTVMCKLEKELMQNQTTLGCALDELTAVVLTPMRPVEPVNKLDVGAQFLRLLNLVTSMVVAKHIVPQDEEMINSVMWILEKAVHNEAFVAHTNQLKEHRFKVSRIKAQFPPKTHYAAAGTKATGAASGVPPNTTSVVAAATGPPDAAMEACAISRSRVPESYQLTDEFKRPVPPASDSDYHSMSSSQSNSTESLDNLFERAMSNPNSLTAQLDFSKLLPIHYAREERRGSSGNVSQFINENSAENKPRLYQRRNSYLTDHSIRNAQPLHIDAVDSVDYSDKYDDHGLTAFSKGPKAVLVRPSSCNDRYEVPQDPKVEKPIVAPNMMHLPPPSPAYPIFDSTKPPPVLVQRGMAFDSPRYSVLKRSNHVVGNLNPSLVEPEAPPKKVIEYYRPKELREMIARTQPLDLSMNPNARKSEAQKFHLEIPAINITNKIEHIFESRPCRPSKIAANFSVPPKTPPPPMKPKAMEPFPALLPSPVNPPRYIVPPKPTTSLAAIVRMAPHVPPQQHMVLTKAPPVPTKPPAVAAAASSANNGSQACAVGMQNVNTWLKSLRLHKYQWLFVDMSYEQMLAITEGQLEQLNITKGARNKLVLSIQKLHERIDVLDKLANDLVAGNILLGDAIDEVILVAQTPMVPAVFADPQNVATKLVTLLTMVFDKIIRSSHGRPDDQSLTNRLAFALDVAAQSEGCAVHQTQLRKMRNRFGGDKKFPR